MLATPADTIMVCDAGNDRVQELTLAGGFVRSFILKHPACIALQDDLLAISSNNALTAPISIFSYRRGGLLRVMGAIGIGSGQIVERVEGLAFSLDKKRLILADHSGGRLSVFKTTGQFLDHIGEGHIGKGGFNGLCVARSGVTN